jgi:hypothetical protein
MDEHEAFFQFDLRGAGVVGRARAVFLYCCGDGIVRSRTSQAFGKDWLEELELVDSPPSPTKRHWRAVTIAASARLAGRLSEGWLDL